MLSAAPLTSRLSRHLHTTRTPWGTGILGVPSGPPPLGVSPGLCYALGTGRSGGPVRAGTGWIIGKGISNHACASPGRWGVSYHAHFPLRGLLPPRAVRGVRQLPLLLLHCSRGRVRLPSPLGRGDVALLLTVESTVLVSYSTLYH